MTISLFHLINHHYNYSIARWVCRERKPSNFKSSNVSRIPAKTLASEPSPVFWVAESLVDMQLRRWIPLVDND